MSLSPRQQQQQHRAVVPTRSRDRTVQSTKATSSSLPPVGSTANPRTSLTGKLTRGTVSTRGTGANIPPTRKSTTATTTTTMTTMTTSSSRAVAPPRQYGDLVESDEVHEEIRALGTQVRDAIATYLPQHGTSEAQTLAAVRQFGPSKASRQMLNRENEAAMLAHEKGIYIVWRCLAERVGGGYRQSARTVTGGAYDGDRALTRGAPKMLSGATNDFCTRIGYRSVCFCGHRLACHTMPCLNGKNSSMKSPCEEAGCSCRQYRYVPSCPEEIGEGWLSRRRGFDLKAWSPKCRCGHGCNAHDAGGFRCSQCGCGQFASHFLCVVCDQPWEAHETVFETESERLQMGHPVREEFFPLSGVDWDVRAMVLKDATGNGALAPPPTSHNTIMGGGGADSSSGRRALREGSAGCRPKRITDSSARGNASAEENRVEVLPDEDDVKASVLPAYCTSCATVFRDSQSNFCAKCGKLRTS